jgi:hypothetical protein
MFIKITKSVVHLGYGYRPGFTGDVPDHIAKDLIKMERAVLLPSPKVREEEKEVEPEVIHAVVKKTRKRKV